MTPTNGKNRQVTEGGVLLAWRGMDRRGRGSIGSMLPPIEGLAAWTKAKYGARWRWLEVKHGDTIVAAITDHPDTGARIWWADDITGGDDA